MKVAAGSSRQTAVSIQCNLTEYDFTWVVNFNTSSYVFTNLRSHHDGEEEKEEEEDGEEEEKEEEGGGEKGETWVERRKAWKIRNGRK